jgi:hypothetical protein
MLQSISSPRPEGPSPPLLRRYTPSSLQGQPFVCTLDLAVKCEFLQFKRPSNVAVAGTPAVVPMALLQVFLAHAPHFHFDEIGKYADEVVDI